MRRPLAILLLASLASASGCTRHGKIAAGSIMAVTGIAIAGQPNTTVTREGWLGGTYQDEDHSNDVLGGLLAVTGALLMLAGVASRDESDEPRTVMMVPVPTYAPVYMPAPEPQPPHPTTVVHAPNAQTVIVTDSVVIEHAPSTTVVVNPDADVP